MPRLCQRVLAERGRDVGALDLVELDGQRTRLEHEREVLGLLEAAALAEVDLGVPARDPIRVALEVDVWRRLELAVEHDREVLREVGGSPCWPAWVYFSAAALGLLLRDLLELAGAVARELKQSRSAGFSCRSPRASRRGRGRRRSSPAPDSARCRGSTSAGSSRCRAVDGPVAPRQPFDAAQLTTSVCAGTFEHLGLWWSRPAVRLEQLLQRRRLALHVRVLDGRGRLRDPSSSPSS